MPGLSEDEFDKLLHSKQRDGEQNDFVHDEEFSLDDNDAEDLALLREALGNYKAETLKFAEQQSNSMAVPRVTGAIALWDSTPRWAIGTAAVLALGCTTVLATHRSTNDPAPMAAAPTAQALHDDNSLLLSVDQALSASADPTEAELGLTAAPSHTTKTVRATN